MTIHCKSTEQMVEITAHLVRKGLTFKVAETTHDEWIITFLGGY
jgi:hypothetical protein